MARGSRIILYAWLTLTLFNIDILAQSTEFGYQGQLQMASAPASGNFDFEFLLYDALSGGAQVGSTLTRSSVPVTGGAFSVKLDFGSNFPGANRFLEIHVRPTGGGTFTPLIPRQAISSSPYSVKSISADTAGNATSLGGIGAGQYVLTSDGRLNDARSPLPGSSNYVQNTISPQAASNFNIDGNGVVGGNLFTNGNVGVGVPAPTQKLQVAGVVQSTTGGFMFPDATVQTTAVAAGAVNRVVRGIINFSGNSYEVSVNFSPTVDPTKCEVRLSDAIREPGNGNGPLVSPVLLVSLDSNTIRVALSVATATPGLSPHRVSFQIIEYK